MPPRVIPVLASSAFVLIWSTGFVVARLIVPAVSPLTFLSVRFTLAAILLAVVSGARWPATRSAWRDCAVSGALMQAAYLGGVFWAISHGVPAALSALITGGQPILTAVLARPLLGEKVGGRKWAGVGVGTLGIALVLGPRLCGTSGIPMPALVVSALSTLAITLGTAWQKRNSASTDVAPDAAIQFAVSAPLVLSVALVSERTPIHLMPVFWIGLAWAVFGLSIGAIGLLLWLLRRTALVGVAALMFLVPPCTALMSYGLFGDTLNAIQIAGMIFAAIGVAVTARS